MLYSDLFNAEGVLQEVLQILLSVAAEGQLIVRLCLLPQGRADLFHDLTQAVRPHFAKPSLAIVRLQCLYIEGMDACERPSTECASNLLSGEHSWSSLRKSFPRRCNGRHEMPVDASLSSEKGLDNGGSLEWL